MTIACNKRERWALNVPADESLALITEHAEADGLGLQAVLAEHIHSPDNCGPAGLVVMEQISSQEDEVDLQRCSLVGMLRTSRQICRIAWHSTASRVAIRQWSRGEIRPC